MTVDGKQGDVAAMRYCLAQCDPAIAQPFTQRIEGITASRDFLTEYIDNGNVLIPCKEVEGGVRPYMNVYIDKEHKELNPACHITNRAQLASWKNKGIAIFALFPCRNNLLVIDLDKGDAHANKADGIKDFIDLIATLKLTPIEQTYFADFPANFPCYVESAGGGIHLYFQDGDTIKLLKSQIAQRAANTNIEVKYPTQVTVAGSVKKGKTYVMRGMLQNTPTMPLTLLNALIKPQPKPQTQYKSTYKPYPKKQSGGAKWNTTAEGIIAKAREKHGGDNTHEFIRVLATYFRNSGYGVNIALQYALQTKEHLQRTDKNDTETCIKSIYANH